MKKNQVLQVEKLRKTYGTAIAVDEISFEVQEGEICGVVGPNGAGKTTTIEYLEGLRQPDSGILRELALDPTTKSHALRTRIGMQLHQSNLPDRMKIWEALDLYNSFYPKTKGNSDFQHDYCTLFFPLFNLLNSD